MDSLGGLASSPPPSPPPLPPHEGDKGRSQALLSKPTYSKRHGSASGSQSPSLAHPAEPAAAPAPVAAPAAAPAAPAAPPPAAAPTARGSGIDIADVWNLSSRAEADLVEGSRAESEQSEAAPMEPPIFHAEGESAPASAAEPYRLDSIMRHKQRRNRRPLLRRTALAAAAAVTLGLPAGAAVFYLAGRADTVSTPSKEATAEGVDGDTGAATS